MSLFSFFFLLAKVKKKKSLDFLLSIYIYIVPQWTKQGVCSHLMKGIGHVAADWIGPDGPGSNAGRLSYYKARASIGLKQHCLYMF